MNDVSQMDMNVVAFEPKIVCGEMDNYVEGVNDSSISYHIHPPTPPSLWFIVNWLETPEKR